MIVLDEPEINLHPEKQNDLIGLLQEYHAGSALVATHSVELMNNVSVSHIIHVQKKQRRPIVKSARDRAALEIIRSQIGSTFNLIASQFESFDRIVFTENSADFKILTELAKALGRNVAAFNIPIHGFSEYRKALPYRDAYKLLIGRDPAYSMMLDRDYYPDEYLDKVRQELSAVGITLVLTPGKEIENLFLSPSVIRSLIPAKFLDTWSAVWEKLCQDQYLDCYGSFITLHQKFILPRVDPKTITTKFTPGFSEKWNNREARHLTVAGKHALQRLRAFYREHCGRNLTQNVLVKVAVDADRKAIRQLINEVFGK